MDRIMTSESRVGKRIGFRPHVIWAIFMALGATYSNAGEIGREAEVIVAQANQVQSGTNKAERIIGKCKLVSVYQNEGYQTQVEITPGIDANSYFWHYDKNAYMKINFDDANIALLQQPKHGNLTNKVWDSLLGKYISQPDGTSQRWLNHYKYLPDKGYSGKDFVVMQAEKDGIKVKIQYFIHATEAVNADFLCERKEGIWKISSILDANDHVPN